MNITIETPERVDFLNVKNDYKITFHKDFILKQIEKSGIFWISKRKYNYFSHKNLTKITMKTKSGNQSKSLTGWEIASKIKNILNLNDFDFDVFENFILI